MNIETMYKEITDLDEDWEIIRDGQEYVCYKNYTVSNKPYFAGTTIEDAVRKAWLFVFKELGAEEYRKQYL